MPFRPIFLVGLVALFPTSLWAESANLAPDEAAVLHRIIDHACLELIEDYTGCERVFLMNTGDSADLLILKDPRAQDSDIPILVARNFEFAGSLWGEWPEIAQAENGNLLIGQENFASGRMGWSRDITLAWQDGRFVIAGYRFASVDRLGPFVGSCEVNLRSGEWESYIGVYEERTDRGKVDAELIAASDWTIDHAIPAPCPGVFSQFQADLALCESNTAPAGCTPE